MKNFTLILFICIISTYKIFANTTIDSLKNKLKTTENKEKIKILNDLSFKYCFINEDSTLKYSKEAIQLSDKICYSLGKARSLKNIGILYYFKSDFEKSLSYYKQSLDIYKLLGNETGEAKVLNNISIVYLQLGDLKEALKYNFKALRIHEKNDNTDHIASSLNNIGVIYQNINEYDSSLLYFNKSLKLVKDKSNNREIANTLNNIGAVYRDWSDYDNALIYFNKSLKIQKQNGNKMGIAKSENNIGEIYCLLGKYKKSIRHYQKALKSREELGNEQGIASTILHIGEVYVDWKDYERAINCFQEALKIQKQIKHKQGIAISLNNIGGIYSTLNLFDKSLDYYEEALKINKEIGNKLGIGNSYQCIGLIFLNKKINFQKSLFFFKKSLIIYTKINNYEGQISVLNSIGCYYKRTKDYKKAIEYFTKSINIAKKHNLCTEIINNYKSLSEIYEVTGNYKKSLLYSQKHHKLNDSIFNEKSKTIIADFQTKYKTSKKEKEIQILKQEKKINEYELKKQTLLTNLFIIGFFIVFIFIGLIIHAYLLKKRANNTLTLQKEKIQFQKKKLEFTNTLLEKAKKIAEESNNSKSMFLSNMSHEIRTPMNAIIGFANLLTNTILNKKQHSYTNNIINSGDNLMVVINDILDFSKIEAGKLSLEKIKFNINELVHKLITSLTIQASLKQVTIKYFIDKNIPTLIIGDPVRLNQILTNLIGNAIKFAYKNSVVKIELKLQKLTNNARILFNIIDSGEYIPDNKVDKIFECFSQANSNTTRRFGGTGLGLSIVKRLIDLQEGKIEVTSKKNGETKFSFHLNFDVTNEKGASNLLNDKVVLGNCHKKNLKILVVEDNEINQNLFIDVIEEWNKSINVDIAPNGKISLDMLQEKNYDLILMDIQMPIMDGYEATKIIRNSFTPPKNQTPIIAITAHAMIEEKEKCINAGMNDYISKPFTPENLFNKIKIYTCKYIEKGSKNIDISEFICRGI
ncbi:MAG: tetratricopeptide repeat protein [Bacteroidetes bacterium]|nr:tetratricopeptide repeat protein [Bacteroidota bacterium]